MNKSNNTHIPWRKTRAMHQEQAHGSTRGTSRTNTSRTVASRERIRLPFRGGFERHDSVEGAVEISRLWRQWKSMNHSSKTS